jgi:hypothetical protein
MKKAKSKKTDPAPTVMIQNCTFSAANPTLVALAEAARANAEAIKAIADHVQGAPLLSVGG